MEVFYPQIKLVHVSCVVLSGLLFALRGGLLLAGSAAPRHLAVRVVAATIDTTLLTAALMLMTILHQYPFVQPWLTVKVGLLAAYVALGLYAFHGAMPRTRRGALVVAALALYTAVIGIARHHDLLGFARALAG